MASKRRASNEALLLPKERRVGNDQRQQLAYALTELNDQFASWVALNKDSAAHLVWIEGVRDYVQHSIKLLDEGKAFLPADSVKALQQAAEDATIQGRHTDDSSFIAKAPGSRKDNRVLELVHRVVSLNRHFATWVAANKEANPEMWWLEAARDYVQHAKKLVSGFSDVLSLEGSETGSKAATGAPASSAAASEPEEAPSSFRAVPGTAASGFGGFGGLGSNPGSGLRAVTTGMFGTSSSQPAASGKGPAPATGFLPPASTADSFNFGSPPPNASATAAGTGSGATQTTGAFGGFSFGGIAPPASASAPVETGIPGKDATERAPPPTAFAFSGAATTTTAACTDIAGGGTDHTTAPPTGSKVAASDKHEAADLATAATTTTSAATRAFGFSFTGATPAASAPSEAAASGKEAPAPPLTLSATAATHAAAAAATTTASAPKDTTAVGSADAVAAGNGKGSTSDKSAAPDGRSTNTAPSVVTTGLFKFGAPPPTEYTPTAASELAGATAKTTSFSVVSSDTEAAPKPFSFGSTSTASGVAAASTTPAFTFGALTSSAVAASSGSAGVGSPAGSIFGGSDAAAGGGAAPAPFSFGAPTTAIITTTGTGTGAASGTTAFPAASAFGSAPATSSVPAASFFFGGAAAPAASAGTAPASGGFSFGSSAAAFTFAAASQTAATAEEGENNEPEQEPDEYAKEPGGLKVDDSMDILYREKARLQVPLKGPDGKLSGWQAKGVGMLSIRKAKTDGAKPFIAMYKDNGGHLYHAYIYKTMKLVVSDKQKSVAFSAVWSPEGGPPAMNPALFQLKAGKNREFESLVLKLQEDMPE